MSKLSFILGTLIFVTCTFTACSTGTSSSVVNSDITQQTAATQTNKEVSTKTQQQSADTTKDKPYMAEVFADLGGKSAGGIVFDDNNVMYVAKEGKDIIKVTPDGKFETLCSIRSLPEGDPKLDPHMSFISPFVWDMVIDKEKNIYAAAQDRILKITMDGKVSTIIKDDFGGLFGASGIDVDGNGNIYVTNGNKINKYNKNLEKEVFIDGDTVKMDGAVLSYAFSLKLDADCKNLYIGNRAPDSILKFPIEADGKAGTPSLVTKNIYTCPHKLALIDNILYACPGHSGLILKNDLSGNQNFYIAGTEIDNASFAFGKKDFGQHIVYFTSLTSGKIFKYDLDNKNIKISKNKTVK